MAISWSLKVIRIAWESMPMKFTLSRQLSESMKFRVFGVLIFKISRLQKSDQKVQVSWAQISTLSKSLSDYLKFYISNSISCRFHSIRKVQLSPVRGTWVVRGAVRYCHDDDAYHHCHHRWRWWPVVGGAAVEGRDRHGYTCTCTHRY